MSNTILMIGAFDTKGPEYNFLRDQLAKLGARVLAANTGVLGSTDLFDVDIEADEIAQAAGEDLQSLRSQGDRGNAMAVMARGAAITALRLFEQHRFQAVIGMGGSGGSSVVTAAMRALPLGVPKVCVSTIASGDTSPFVGAKDVTLIPSVVDVSGINRISRIILTRAAGAVWGMLQAVPPVANDDRPIVAASMFGNTTKCVDQCRQALNQAGFEVLVFHATGTGGRIMESLVDEGHIDGVLDMTTTEWADEICGGILSAGPDRLSAPGRKRIPHLIAPGCVDMANFGPWESVPAKFKDAGRNLYAWNPAVTLMRTTVDENRQIGEIFAQKANAAKGPVAFLLPLRGISILDGDGERFCDREADEALFDAIKENVNKQIAIVEVDANINDDVFSQRAVELMLELMGRGKAS